MRLRVHVGSLAPEVGTEELRELASKCGRVTAVDLLRSDFDGMSRGYGFVNMADEDGVSKLLRYDNALWRGGRRLRVELARPDYRDRMRLERAQDEPTPAETKPSVPPPTVAVAVPLRGLAPYLGNKIRFEDGSQRFEVESATCTDDDAEEQTSVALFGNAAASSRSTGDPNLPREDAVTHEKVDRPSNSSSAINSDTSPSRSNRPSEERSEDEENVGELSLAAEEEASLAIFRELAGSLDRYQNHEEEEEQSARSAAPLEVDDESGRPSAVAAEEERLGGEAASEAVQSDERDGDGRRQWTALRNVFSAAPVKSFEGGLALSFAASGGVVEHKFNFDALPPVKESQSHSSSEVAAKEEERLSMALPKEQHAEAQLGEEVAVAHKGSSLWASVDDGVQEGRRAIGETDVAAVEARWNENRAPLRQTYRRILRKMQARKRRRTF